VVRLREVLGVFAFPKGAHNKQLGVGHVLQPAVHGKTICPASVFLGGGRDRKQN